jgi:hypothetical protein
MVRIDRRALSVAFLEESIGCVERFEDGKREIHLTR